MSSLFDALKQIEKQAEQDTVQLSQRVAFGQPPKKGRRQPFLKIVLFVLFAGCVGGALIFFIWLKADDLFILKERLVQKMSEQENVTSANIPPAIVSREPAAPVVILPPPVKKVKEKETQIIAAIPDEPAIKAEKRVKIEELVVKHANDVVQITSRVEQNKIRLKKLLYQAEKRRIKGDMVAAVTLYRKAWKLGSNPAVANNLAAALLQMGKKDEAVLILDQALVLSPDDPDLLYNLRIVKEYK